MLMDRIIGVLSFRQGVYADVEHDESFTNTAWLLVAVVAFLNQLGSVASLGSDNVNFITWIIGTLVGTVIAVIGFAVATWVIQAVGKAVFSAEVNFGELVRTLGLAYVWRALGLIGIINFFVPAVLTCLLAPLNLVIAILGLIAWFMAAREALDLDGIQTAVTIIIGWIVIFVFSVITGAILALMGLAAAGAAELLG
jgi:hypothetical protein